MSPDLDATREAVEALSAPGAVYEVAPDGLTLTGALTVVDGRFGAPEGAPGAHGSVQHAFTVTVHLDPASGRYTVTEGSTGASSYDAPLPNAMAGRKWSRSTSSGHVVKRTFGTASSQGSAAGGDSPTRLDYDASNSRLVAPLEAVLAAQGWSRRRGALARLFGF